MKPSAPISHAILLAGMSLPGTAAYADEISVWRAFVADQAQGTVSVIDLEAGEVVDTFALNGPASLYVTSSAQRVFAVQGNANIVQAIDTGIAIDDHGDHGDIEITDPALLDTAIEGEYPVHFVDHHGQIALFFDNEGVAKIIDESDFGATEPRIVPSGAPITVLPLLMAIIRSSPNRTPKTPPTCPSASMCSTPTTGRLAIPTPVRPSW